MCGCAHHICLQASSPLSSACHQCGLGAQSTEQDQTQAWLPLGSAGSRSCHFGQAGFQHHPSHGVMGWKVVVHITRSRLWHSRDRIVHGQGDPISVVLAG